MFQQDYVCENCDAEFHLKSYDEIKFCPFCSNTESFYETTLDIDFDLE